MKREKNGSASPEVKAPSLIVAAPVVSSSTVDSTAPEGGPPPEPQPTVSSTAVSSQKVSRTIRMTLAIVGLAVGLLSTVIRSRVFGTGLGKHALDAKECRSGQLLQTEGGTRLSFGGICTKDCSTEHDCGDGLRCYNGHCAPMGTKAFGQPCDAPWDCQSDLCAALVAIDLPFGRAPLDAEKALPQMTCSQGCPNGEPCPDGYDCTSSPNAGMLCTKHRDGNELLDLLQQLQNRTGMPSEH